MLMFFSGTGKGSTVEAKQKGIDVMMTFFDMFDRDPLPKFQGLHKVRSAKKSKPKKKKKAK